MMIFAQLTLVQAQFIATNNTKEVAAVYRYVIIKTKC